METKIGVSNNFGGYLKYLRRRARLTQRDLGVQVGYSTGQICMLENGQRRPDPTTLAALFVPALGIERDAELSGRLFDLARVSRYHGAARTPQSPRAMPDAGRRFSPATIREEVGTLEDPPKPPHPFVTRPVAQQQLQSGFSSGHLIVMMGLPGMGKTTLAAHFAESHATPVFWMSLSAGINASLEAVLRELSLFAVVHSVNAARAAPLLPDPNDASPLTRDQRIARIAIELRDMRSPLLVLDNAHWLRDDSLFFSAIQHLLNRAQQLRVLLLSREQLPAARAQTVVLDGLTLAEATDLAAQLDPSQNPSANVMPLFERIAGSPLLLRLAITRGSAEGATDDVMTDALSDLSAASQRLIEVLSVVRQSADLTAPDSAGAMAKSFRRYDHAQAVGELQRRRLIETPAAAHAHALVREHVLARLRERPHQLRQAHVAAARWMEQRSNFVECAHHWCWAGELQKACDALADQRESLGAGGKTLDAVGVLDEIISAARPTPHSDVLRQMHTLRGDLLLNTLRSGECLNDYRTALTYAAQPHVRAQLAEKLANALVQRGQNADALAACGQALVLLDGTDAGGINPSATNAIYLRAQLESARGKALLQLARYDEAREASARALALADRISIFMPRLTDILRSASHATLGIVHRIQRRQSEAHTHFLKSIEYARLANWRLAEARQLFNLGNMQLDVGHIESAAGYYEQASAISESVGDVFMLARILNSQSVVLHLRGEDARALKLVERAIELKEQMGDQQGWANSHNQRALILAMLGRLDEARAAVENILDATAHTGEDWLRSQYRNMLGLILTLQGEAARALTIFGELLATDAVQRDSRLRTSVRIYRAVAQLASGDRAGAQLVAAQDIPPEAGMEVGAEHLLLRCAAALADGSDDEARGWITALHGHARGSGCVRYIAHARQLEELIGTRVAPADLPRAMFVVIR